MPAANHKSEPTEVDLAAQRAARDAIQKIDLFPQLERMLIAVFGPSAAAIMLHQLIYWFTKPAMMHRDWLYKRHGEWRDERGLSRRQVDKGRMALTKAGIIEEAKGPYKRVHYRVDWVRLAERLDLTLNPIARPESGTNGVGMPQTPENGRAGSDCPPENGHEPHTYAGKPRGDGGQYRLHGPDAGDLAYLHGEPHESGGQSNTGEYAGEYVQEIPLTEGGDGSESRTALDKKGKEQTGLEEGESPSDIDASLLSDAEQRETSTRGDGAEPRPDADASPAMADSARVARARVSLRALLADWSGYEDDVAVGKWPELARTIQRLGFANERFAAVEVMSAAEGLGSEAAEQEAMVGVG